MSVGRARRGAGPAGDRRYVMSQQHAQSDTKFSEHHRGEFSAHVALAYLLFGVNVLSITIAVRWSVLNWREAIRARGHWGLWPLFWLGGSAVLLLLQFLLSLLPSLAIKRRMEASPMWLRRVVLVLACAGLLATVGGVAAVFIYDAITPAVHHPGM